MNMKQSVAIVAIFTGVLSLIGMQANDLDDQEPVNPAHEIIEISNSDTSESLRHVIAKNITKCPCLQNPLINNAEMTEHIYESHYFSNYKAKYRCLCCPFKTDTLDLLILHFPYHTNENMYKCEVCDIAFSRFPPVVEHIKLHNDHQKEFNFLISHNSCQRKERGFYYCPICKTSIKFLVVFLKHMRNHFNIAPITTSKPEIPLDQSSSKAGETIEQPIDLEAQEPDLIASLLRSFYQFGAKMVGEESESTIMQSEAIPLNESGQEFEQITDEHNGNKRSWSPTTQKLIKEQEEKLFKRRRI